MKKRLPKNLEPKALQESLHDESKQRSVELLQAIQRYSETPYARVMEEPPCIWQRGSARLLDYGTSESGRIILFIPSLINRYYILDLEQERSMLRFLAAEGFYPLVLDWGAPEEDEKDFAINDYVTNVLLPAIDFLYKTSGRPITLAGYCMGGVLALAAAQLRPAKISKLALFATPWNFHCQKFLPFLLDQEYQSMLQSLLAEQDSLPSDAIQALFYVTDPFVFEDKFRRFFNLDPHSRAAKDFIALEHWVNDGVPMTGPVARDCLIGWVQQNQLMGRKWQVLRRTIDPRKITQKTFVAIPKKDHVVPFDCAMPLAQLLRRPKLITPSAGHVGMMVGSRAKTECWAPFAEWARK